MSQTLPAWARWMTIGLATLLLCSCQSGPDASEPPARGPVNHVPPMIGRVSKPALAEPGILAPQNAVALEATSSASEDKGVNEADPQSRTIVDPNIALVEHHSPALPPESARIPYVPAPGYPQRPSTPGGYVMGYAPTNAAPLYYPPAYTLPLSAYTGHPADGYTIPAYGGPLQAGAVPYPAPVPQWAPPGIRRPWPPEEYVCDGCDKRPHVHVAPDGRVYGLELEDTVAHYNTLDGRTVVEPSNCVCLYAPRFAAIRKVTGMKIAEQHQRITGIATPVGPNTHGDVVGPMAVRAPLRPIDRVGMKSPIALFRPERLVLLERTLGPKAFLNNWLPYEDLTAIREGQYKIEEKARLAEATEAALIWNELDAVVVILDEKMAYQAKGVNAAREIVEYHLDGEPKIKLCKVASKCAAQPGDIVEFTLRYDNIGTQTLVDVTILDNLSGRLEYVPDTAQSSRESVFSVERNEAESQVLRWQLKAPLKKCQGGVVRFKARVR